MFPFTSDYYYLFDPSNNTMVKTVVPNKPLLQKTALNTAIARIFHVCIPDRISNEQCKSSLEPRTLLLYFKDLIKSCPINPLENLVNIDKLTQVADNLLKKEKVFDLEKFTKEELIDISNSLTSLIDWLIQLFLIEKASDLFQIALEKKLLSPCSEQISFLCLRMCTSTLKFHQRGALHTAKLWKIIDEEGLWWKIRRTLLFENLMQNIIKKLNKHEESEKKIFIEIRNRLTDLKMSNNLTELQNDLKNIKDNTTAYVNIANSLHKYAKRIESTDEKCQTKFKRVVIKFFQQICECINSNENNDQWLKFAYKFRKNSQIQNAIKSNTQDLCDLYIKYIQTALTNHPKKQLQQIHEIMELLLKTAFDSSSPCLNEDTYIKISEYLYNVLCELPQNEVSIPQSLIEQIKKCHLNLLKKLLENESFNAISELTRILDSWILQPDEKFSWLKIIIRKKNLNAKLVEIAESIYLKILEKPKPLSSIVCSKLARYYMDQNEPQKVKHWMGRLKEFQVGCSWDRKSSNLQFKYADFLLKQKEYVTDTVVEILSKLNSIKGISKKCLSSGWMDLIEQLLEKQRLFEASKILIENHKNFSNTSRISNWKKKAEDLVGSFITQHKVNFKLQTHDLINILRVIKQYKITQSDHLHSILILILKQTNERIIRSTIPELCNDTFNSEQIFSKSPKERAEYGVTYSKCLARFPDQYFLTLSRDDSFLQSVFEGFPSYRQQANRYIMKGLLILAKSTKKRDQIVSQILNLLKKCKKPTDKKERLDFYQDITIPLLRLCGNSKNPVHLNYCCDQFEKLIREQSFSSEVFGIYKNLLGKISKLQFSIKKPTVDRLFNVTELILKSGGAGINYFECSRLSARLTTKKGYLMSALMLRKGIKEFDTIRTSPTQRDISQVRELINELYQQNEDEEVLRYTQDCLECKNSSSFFRSNNEYSLTYEKLLLKITSNSPEKYDHNLLDTLLNEAIEKTKSRDFSKAIEKFNAASKVAYRMHEHGKVVNCYCRIGDIYRKIRNYDEAKRWCKRGLFICKRSGDTLLIACAHYYLGRIYSDLEKYEKAIKYFQCALKNFKIIDDQKRMAGVYSELGYAFSLMNKYEQSLSCYKKCKIIRKQLKDEMGLCHAYENLGYIYELRGKYNKAINYYKKCLEIANKCDDKSFIPLVYNKIAIAYLEKDEFIKSEEFFQRALNGFKETKDRSREAYLYLKLGHLYMKQNKLEKALEYYKKSLQIFQKLNKNKMTTLINLYMGKAYDSLGKYEKSVKCYKESYQLLKETRNNPRVAERCYYIASQYYKLNKLEKAEKYFKESIVVYKKLNQSLLDKQRIFGNRFLTYKGLLTVLWKQKKYDEALFVGVSGGDEAFKALIDRCINSNPAVVKKSQNYGPNKIDFRQPMSIEQFIDSLGSRTLLFFSVLSESINLTKKETSCEEINVIYTWVISPRFEKIKCRRIELTDDIDAELKEYLALNQHSHRNNSIRSYQLKSFSNPGSLKNKEEKNPINKHDTFDKFLLNSIKDLLPLDSKEKKVIIVPHDLLCEIPFKERFFSLEK